MALPKITMVVFEREDGDLEIRAKCPHSGSKEMYNRSLGFPETA